MGIVYKECKSSDQKKKLINNLQSALTIFRASNDRAQKEAILYDIVPLFMKICHCFNVRYETSTSSEKLSSSFRIQYTPKSRKVIVIIPKNFLVLIKNRENPIAEIFEHFFREVIDCK